MFYWLILGISVAPYVIFPAVFAGKTPPNTEMVRQTILFLANAHIAMTAYFYWDRGFRGIITANRRRYVTLPALAVVGSAVTYAATPGANLFLWWAVYAAWQNWHFGKQTFGVYAMVSVDQTPGKRVQPIERVLIYASIFAGALGVLWMMNPGQWTEETLLLRTVCGYITAAVAAAAVVYIIATRMPAKRAIFLLFSVLFFAPQYVAEKGSAAILTYSVAHSFQYLFFMAVVAFNTRTEQRENIDPKLIIALVFFGIMIVGGAIITIREDFGALVQALTGIQLAGRLVVGAMFGLVIAHFVIDAHAWRLRDKPQREFVMDRMRFLWR